MSFLIWLQESPFGLWVAESIWAYPIILTLHTVGFGVLVGTSAFLDLRLLGVGAGVPLAPLEILILCEMDRSHHQRAHRRGALRRSSDGERNADDLLRQT